MQFSVASRAGVTSPDKAATHALLGITYLTPLDAACAASFAAQLGLPVLGTCAASRELPRDKLVLEVAEGVPSIRMTGRGVAGPVSAGFDDAALAARRRAGHNELLGRAVGWKQSRAPSVLDATGGFGRDAFVLADLGCEVQICEREPAMALLLGEAIRRARESDDAWLQQVASRMHLCPGEAQEVFAQRAIEYDVIYLDPMFPLDRKAAPGKEMQVLHQLLSSRQESAEGSAEACNLDAVGLFEWACAQPVARVVVKRPRRAPALSASPPGFALRGRSVRFDVYPQAHKNTL